ncbi:type IV secretory system conjugative DNA transfer family protein [Xanthomonas arboricola]|uniref:Intracellular multiplication protein IcmO n=1 Tax=Xanthomonas arboricola TaxID=56448 RepID=A0AB73H1P1_9XANT|nr:TraM recognition domain-containing protein [Xanthomonas arboricola]MBB5672304.1 intracellular multiplication protein IcmO [Xanthomonas arboricola]
MADGQIQGVSRKQEIQRARIMRDTRRISEQVLDFLGRLEVTFGLGLVAIAFTIAVPALFDIMVLLSLAYVPVVFRRKVDIPFRKRKALGEVDQKDLHPGTGKPQQGRGIAFIGNRKEDGLEIWGANEDMRTHVFVLGSTGAGKTEGLTSLAMNALNWCSGFAYTDGKGDVNLWGKVFSCVRQYGREDDLLVINYMTGNSDTKLKRTDKLSNTYNPFMVGNAESLIQLLVSLMDASDGKGDMWKGRAISFISVIMPALVDLRDQDRLMLHIGAIRAAMPFPKYWELMSDPHISERSRDQMRAFLYDVPGFKPDKGDQQAGTFLEQFGYQQMQFTRILSSLADTYGHIYQTPAGEVNFKDVVTNRRILLVLLPALEKSRPELANLGKIIVAAMKGMMGGELGSKLEGGKRELLDSRTTNAPTPFIAIFDEFGYYMPEDAALMWAQARSLGFCLIAAGQDLQAFYRTSKEETLAIVSNSNIKIFGKLEDPNETYDLFEKRAGEAWVSELDSYDLNTEGYIGGYRPGTGARHSRSKRVDMQDMVEQIEGEVHILVKSDIIRARMFYAVPDKAKHYKLNHFIKVMPHSEADIKKRLVDTPALIKSLLQYPFKDQAVDPDHVLGAVERAAEGERIASYVTARQGAEIGISLFVAAKRALQRPAASNDGETEAGGAGGHVHTPEPATDGQAEAAAPAVSVASLIDPAAHESVGEDVVFDGGQLDSYSVFGPQAIATTDEDALFASAASDIIYSSAGAAPVDGEVLSFLKQSETATSLRDIASAMGASADQASAIARGMIEQTAGSTRYPAQPKPALTPEAEEEMANTLHELQRLVEENSQGARQ